MNIKNILNIASEKGASDVHLLVGQPPVLRVDGVLKDINSIWQGKEYYGPLTEMDMSLSIDTILNKEQKVRLYEDKDLDCGYALDNVRFRVNISFEKGNLSLVARVIEETKPSLDEIGMPPILKTLLESQEGLILVTGPTGCGKSTTLAAMINHINTTRSCNIITLEDPVEFIFTSDKSLVSQRQLGSDMKTFASGLKHVLRQDPNVIMIGEMRDLETISAAITLAETGHLVLATLHTYNSIQTVDRIIDIFPPHQQSQVKSQLSMLLKAIISQRLISRTSGGRIAAREILIRNGAVSNLIREGKIAQLKSVMETHSQEGMLTLDSHLKDLYKQGEISLETMQIYLDDKQLM